MKETFTLEEVISIITEIHKSDFEYPIKEYADFNNFNEEQAVYYATDEFISEKGWK
ncbi:hypothetical protein [Leuconostoc mesenteroides]|uniref:hypothetical protein n=1 Tax=Leuconostoc mesenteroides TaxID=1245 RepID=UPI00207467CE|nr:hypothetical protein [Leuconostoc mesenteroides]MCM6831240.1 hypothetical protein [Leuconostoc mesenteroides]